MSHGRRFAVGQGGEIGGIPWRIRQGSKGPDDYVLEFFTPAHEWQPARMHLAALMVDFLQENEERLFPQEVGNQGRRMFFNFLRRSIEAGWEAACAELDIQMRRARGRREEAAAA